VSKYDVDLIGDEGPAPDEGEGEPWMTSYLDVMTLLFAFFVLLVSMSEFRTERVPVVTVQDSIGSPPGTAGPDVSASGTGIQAGILPGGTGVLPAFEAPILTTAEPSPANGPDSDTATTANDEFAERFSELEESFNELALQGVDATLGTEGLTLRIADNLLFPSGQDELMYQGMILLSQLAGFLLDYNGQISIEGHTDNVPINTARFPSNWELSTARAISVLRYLEQDGVSANRMRAVGYAETRPLQPNDSADGRAANRRVELILREP